MTWNGWLQIAIFSLLTLAVVKPLGAFMAQVFAGERTFLHPVLRPLERAIYWCCGVDEQQEQHWVTYAVAMLFFSIAGFVTLYALQRLQGVLPLQRVFNPAGQSAVEQSSAFNTAVSFVTNTNWQGYGGETTMSYLTQMAGLTVHNFVSAATGIALMLALIRGFARRSAQTVGNFWVDLTRCTLYVLLPLSIVMALALIVCGLPQNLNAYTDAATLEGAKQVIAQGPVASQIAIKQLGTNGGGFFNVNSAHPFENPNAITNLIEMWAIFAISAALTYTFGRMVRRPAPGLGDLRRHGRPVPGRPRRLLSGRVAGQSGLRRDAHRPDARCLAGRRQHGRQGSPLRHRQLDDLGDRDDRRLVRLGQLDARQLHAASAARCRSSTSCWARSSSAASAPASTACSLFAIVAMFVAGLMVGRTPEYLGKKLEAREVKMAMLAMLSLPLSILGFTALAAVLPAGLAGPANAGPHGFSEILYAYTSATGNNGSAFAGLSANTLFYNMTIGVAMLIGRFLFIVPMLAVAGSLAAKKIVPPSAGTFPTHQPLFVGLLVGVILIVGGLTYFPALALGPMVEQFAMQAGTLY